MLTLYRKNTESLSNLSTANGHFHQEKKKRNNVENPLKKHQSGANCL